jgi:ribosome-binding factor A
MPKDYSRTRRVAELLQRELAAVIATELDDPRLELVTITGVEVTRDYAWATVYYTHLGDADQIKAAGAALEHAAGLLRHEMSARLDLRTTPRLRFHYDSSVERGRALYEKLERLGGESGRKK